MKKLNIYYEHIIRHMEKPLKKTFYLWALGNHICIINYSYNYKLYIINPRTLKIKNPCYQPGMKLLRKKVWFINTAPAATIVYYANMTVI